MKPDAADNIRRWRESPLSMVRELFEVEPDLWQIDALNAFPTSPRLAMKACVGPGKTAVLAWIGWNFMLTRPHPMIGATSITGDNLKTNLWTELARWRNKSALLTRTFEQTKTEIYERNNQATWRMEARSWSKDADASQIGHSLAGLHSKYVMWLLDESGGYPEAVLPTTEGIFSGNPEEAHIVQAGNPLKLSGPLYRACTVARDLWKVIEITGDPDDPKRSPRISIEYAREQIRQYGKDNPWVLVRIFGKFPPSDINALIGPDEVSEAMKRFYRPFQIGTAAKIIAADVARYGDDACVIAKREGIQMYPFDKKRNLDSTQGAGWVARTWDDWQANACFVDATGGYGGGWIDQLVNMGRAPIGVQFAGEAHEKGRYFNKRAEMAFEFVEWIKRGGALPESPELAAALTMTTYTFHRDKFLLEPKDDIKIKLGYSPDEFDAAIMTFAEPVTVQKPARRPQRMQTEYDPFSSVGGDLENHVNRSYGGGNAPYDPFRGG